MGVIPAARAITAQSPSYLLRPYFSLLPMTATKISRPFPLLLPPNRPHVALLLTAEAAAVVKTLKGDLILTVVAPQ